MHMVYPNLFIIWDTNIRDNWGVTGTAEGYTTFLIRMQNEYRELVEDYAKINAIDLMDAKRKIIQEMNRNINNNMLITRWIDIYNWTKFTHLKEEL